jgi:hypothetical protein
MFGEIEMVTMVAGVDVDNFPAPGYFHSLPEMTIAGHVANASG